MLQLEDYAGGSRKRDDLDRRAALKPQREGRLERPIRRARPGRPQRAFRTGDLDDLVMLPPAERLRDHGVAPTGEVERPAEVILQFREVGPLRLGPGVDG